MLRYFLCSMFVLGLCATSVLADDTKKDAKKDEPVKAKIVKMDAKNHTITVKMQGKDGKEVEKTFKLAEDIRYFDSTGKAVLVDVFQNGNDVLVVEHEGTLKELRMDKKKEDKKDK